jgi:hypothetical protein
VTSHRATSTSAVAYREQLLFSMIRFAVERKDGSHACERGAGLAPAARLARWLPRFRISMRAGRLRQIGTVRNPACWNIGHDLPACKNSARERERKVRATGKLRSLEFRSPHSRRLRLRNASRRLRILAQRYFLYRYPWGRHGNARCVQLGRQGK